MRVRNASENRLIEKNQTTHVTPERKRISGSKSRHDLLSSSKKINSKIGSGLKELMNHT
jgi:hypothetical protein